MTFALSLLPIAVLVAALVVVKAPAWKAALAALVLPTTFAWVVLA